MYTSESRGSDEAGEGSYKVCTFQAVRTYCATCKLAVLHFFALDWVITFLRPIVPYTLLTVMFVIFFLDTSLLITKCVVFQISMLNILEKGEKNE